MQIEKRMKRKGFLLLGSLFLLASCNRQADISSSFATETEYVVSKITTVAEEVIPYATEFEYFESLNNANKYANRKCEKLTYTTDAYEDGITYEKYVMVFLPLDYNPDDTSKKYNVLYCQHGNTGTPDTYAGGLYRKQFSNLFDKDVCGLDNCILVFPTYYLNYQDPENKAIIGETGKAPAGDGAYSGIKGNYYKEIREDVIPLVETHYNTYLEENSDQGIKNSRSHRAFAGYSRGSASTWDMFHYNLEYFQYFCPMSCNCMGNRETEADETTAYLWCKEAIDKRPDLDFFLYASVGNSTDVPLMRTQMNYLLKDTTLFSFGKDPEKNNVYFSISDFDHGDHYVGFYLYNSLQVIFH